MLLEVHPDFPHPALLLVASRPAGAAAPPAQPIGVLIVKQGVRADGAPLADVEILQQDEPYAAPGGLALRLEADLVPFKPALDAVVVRASQLPGPFGQARVRAGGSYTAWQPLDYGWRSRDDGPRLGEAGDAEHFRPTAVTDPANPPPLAEMLALPAGFRGSFCNGGRLPNLPRLRAADRVEFDDGSSVRAVSVPAGPAVAFLQAGQPLAAPPAVDLAVDTVVFDETAVSFLITWRGTFPWEDRLSLATLEVR